MEKFTILLLAGITNGSVYGLIGLSLSLIYSTSRVINFAQGEFVMLGAMMTIFFMVTLQLPGVVAVPGVLVVLLIAGLCLERFVYRALAARNAEPLTVIIGTFAGAVILAGLALVIWGPNQLYVPPVFSLSPMMIAGVTTTAQQIAIILSFVALMAGFWWLLYRTSFGLCVRATGVNPKVALLMGIRSERIIRFGFLFSAGVSGIAGILLGPLLGGQFSMGLLLTVKGFMAAIVGGLGSMFAAAAGGILIGLLEAMVTGYGTSLYSEPILFGLVLIVLLVRPYGLLGEFEASKR